MESKEVKHKEAESRIVVNGEEEVEGIGAYRSKGTKLQLCRARKSRELIHSMMTFIS